MLRVGLTGGIGSGKSSVCDLFAAHGVPIIDADVVAHRLTAKGSKLESEIIQHYGAAACDAAGCLDRSKLKAIVFNSASELAWLNQLIHPQVRAAMAAEVAALGSSKLVIICIPLLYENNLQSDFDCTLAVVCPVELQLQRTAGRDRIQRDLIQKIILTQVSDQTRENLSDYLIGNDGTLEQLSNDC